MQQVASQSSILPELLDLGRRRLEEACTACRLRVRSNNNQRTLVSLRHNRSGWVLSLRPELLQESALHEELIRFVQQRGRGAFPKLKAAMQQLFYRIQQDQASLQRPLPLMQALPPIRLPLDLSALLRSVAAEYWPQLSLPSIAWSRNPGLRPLRSIRFGVYRSHPQPQIRVHPRLSLPWVAACFVEFIIYHELCHHAQYCQPRRGESAHSRRFRSWEGRFAGFQQIRAWEQRQIPAFLDPQAYPQGC